MSDRTETWDSGLLQVRSAHLGDGCTIGHASLARDALGQSLACFVLWLPEGFMSNDYEWARSMYVLANLIDSRVDVLFDLRSDTGEISRAGSFPLPQAAEGQDSPLSWPEEFSDGEVFVALIDAIQSTWQVEPVEEATLALLREQTRPSREFEDGVARMHRWQ